MLRRLFFLFPDVERTRLAVVGLQQRGVNTSRVHVMADSAELDGLPEATPRQKQDVAFQLEKIIWTSNLILFGLLLGMMIIALTAGKLLAAIILLALLLVSFLVAEQFVVKVPNVHLSEFEHALSHGDILMMVDVHAAEVTEIEEFIHRHYPYAVVGGVGWTLDHFGI